MRIGIFGGTFDPPHHGHLIAANDAADALGLDTLWFVPNAMQPLKGSVEAPPHHRLEMVRRLAGSGGRFRVDPIEIDRAGLSYTVDTLRAFALRYPDAERWLILGADVAGSFGEWREPERIVELARIAILHRATAPPGEPPQPGPQPGEAEELLLRGARWLPERRIDISSTEIRDRIRQGRSIRGFVPDAVAEYIAAAGLYR